MNSWQNVWDIYRVIPDKDLKNIVAVKFLTIHKIEDIKPPYSPDFAAECMYEALIDCGVIKPRSTTDDGAEEYEAIMAADEIMGERSAGS